MKFLVVFLLALLAGCSGRVYPQELEKAQELCKDHGGVSYVQGRAIHEEEIGTVAAICKDSTYIVQYFEEALQK